MILLVFNLVDSTVLRFVECDEVPTGGTLVSILEDAVWWTNFLPLASVLKTMSPKIIGGFNSLAWVRGKFLVLLCNSILCRLSWINCLYVRWVHLINIEYPEGIRVSKTHWTTRLGLCFALNGPAFVSNFCFLSRICSPEPIHSMSCLRFAKINLTMIDLSCS